ncbi:MAG: hypothetical protein GX410_10945, partial [Elusimicrobia bacterium]|nr:hypothetical protein [Elusimicrobiota bacterium]
MKKNLMLLLSSLAAVLLALECGWRSYYFAKNHFHGGKAAFELYAVGESTVRGFGDISFADAVAETFKNSFGPGGLSYRNMGRTGYTSYPHWMSLRAEMAFRRRGTPGALILYTGHNEAIDRELPGKFRSFWLRHCERLLDHSYFLSDMLYRLRRKGLLRVDGSYLWYELNLRRIIETARDSGLTPILSTLAVNYSGVEPSFDMRDESSLNEHLRRGLELEARSFSSAARYYLELSGEDKDTKALWFFCAARCYERSGDYAAARENYREAVNWDKRVTYRRANCLQNDL